jgi:hypothetical protein
VATAAFDLNTTLTSKAGYIDVNNNAKIDSDVDIPLPDTFELKAPAGVSVISPISDLVANGADKAKLAAILGVDENVLFSDPIATNNIDLAKAIQIVYALKSVNKETDLVAKVNSYQVTQNASQSASQTDLPTFDQTVTTQPETEENASSEPATTDLPPMGRLAKVSTDLPTFDEPVVTANNEQNAETNNTQNETNTQSQSENTVTGGIAVLAQLAQEVAGDNEKVKALIQAVLSANVTNAADLESAVANVKKELVAQNEATQEAAESAQNEAASEVNETAEHAESEANETAESAQSEAEEAAENAQNEANETSDNESENEEIQTPPSVPTDLPTF